MDESIYCSACGEVNAHTAKFCSKCGARLTSHSIHAAGAPPNLREPTYMERGELAQKTVYESGSMREKTVLERSGFGEKTTLEMSSVRERTVLEPDNPSSQPAGSAPSAPTSQAPTRFMEPTVLVGASKDNGAPRLAGWLVGLEGPGEGRDHRLCVGKNTIGRHPNSGVLISDSSVSAEHAVLWIEDGACTIADQQSKNGVLINQVRIFQPTVVNDGDWVTIGTATLQMVVFHAREGL